MGNYSKSTIYEWLLEQYARRDQLELFMEIFPIGGPTREDLLTASKSGYDLIWFARTILRGEDLKILHDAIAAAETAHRVVSASARNAYDEVLVTAVKAFNEAGALALIAYEVAISPTEVTVDEEEDETSEEYDLVIAPAETIYRKARVTFETAYYEAVTLAEEEHERVIAEAAEVYNETIINALADILGL